MYITKLIMCVCLGAFLCLPAFSQTHTAVSLENQLYYILEQAEAKGLCAPLSGARPYTQSDVISAIREILKSEDTKRLNAVERGILDQYLEQFSKPKSGLDLRNGSYYGETTLGGNTVISANAGVSADIEGSAGFYPSVGERYFGAEIWAQFYLNGDLGKYLSYGITAEGGLVQVPRKKLGNGHTYYKNFVNDSDEYTDQLTTVYSEPLAHFPYSYKKRWDGSVYFLSELSALEYWPESVAGAYNLPAELTGSFLENKLIMRVGRISREWGSVPFGSSLALNQMARPFLGVETEFNPVSWFGMASLTGILEYNNTAGIKESSMTNQNAFSANMLQFRYKNYLFLDLIDSVVWPKRFELGYIVPIVSNFFYQNFIGDFDNLAMTLNLRAQYPGLGTIWGSLFIDEMDVNSKMFELDRTMIAWQAGLNVPLSFLAFSSIKLSYTKVNPYCYGHNRNYNPWYGDNIMETSYTNNGVSLGYYIPPNSDEILFRFKTMPAKNLHTHLQYQLIRHGASYGSGEVDGSSLLSELDPDGRSSKDVLRSYFLHDGAYQWMHIVKIGAEWQLPKMPVSFYGEAGVNYSYFTNIESGKENSGQPYPYSVIDTAEYPKSTGVIINLGVKVFPR